MSYDWQAKKALAERLIAKFGQTVILVQQAKTGPDYAPIVISTETPIVAVELDASSKDRSGSNVGATMRKLYVSTSAGVQPNKGDKITLGGVKHEIDKVSPFSPAGTVVFYEVDIVT